jgi:FtsH-binding integral membrane protein
MGLFGVIIASVVNIWLASSMLQWIVSIVGLLVFAGFTAYDTQDIKNMYDVNDDGTVAGRKSIMGALRLYLDFLNIFLFMLQLLGNRE